MTGPRGDLAPIVGGLGKKVDYPAPATPEYVEASDIGPYWWRDAQGRLKYAPPMTPLPVVVTIW